MKSLLNIANSTLLMSLLIPVVSQPTQAEYIPENKLASQPSILAQTNTCREVDVNTQLNVREQPNGRIIGGLSDEQLVDLAGEPNNGWVRISNPVNGYVYAGYLTYCNQAQAPQTQQQTSQNPSPNSEISTVPGSNCRAVNSPNVVVRQEPGGPVVGRLDENEAVFIANEGYNGWVPIEAPINGYITSANLKPCPPETSTYNPPNDTDAVGTVPVSNCRETNTSNVQVFAQPGGTVVGQLENDKTVYIANEGRDGWVPIETPISGFVDASNLTYCQGTATTFPTSSCRRVNSQVSVYKQPGSNQPIALLDAQQNVSIQNRGQDGWVPIVAPLSGYVQADSLEYCP